MLFANKHIAWLMHKGAKPFMCIAVTFFSVPVLAGDACDDLWFSRNAIFHANGYCFASPLGKAIFGNTGCSEKPLNLSLYDQTKIAHIKEEEWRRECKVDTARTTLNIDAIKLRFLLITQPVSDRLESSCINYKGPDPILLFAGLSLNSLKIGQVEPGDNVNWKHYGESGWAFVTVYSNDYGYVKTVGWTNQAEFECENYAG